MKFSRFKLALVIAVFAAAAASPFSRVEARKKYMAAYDADPLSRPELHGNCGICHVSKRGGGERTHFGEAFEEAGLKFTPELRTKFPQFFK